MLWLLSLKHLSQLPDKSVTSARTATKRTLMLSLLKPLLLALSKRLQVVLQSTMKVNTLISMEMSAKMR